MRAIIYAAISLATALAMLTACAPAAPTAAPSQPTAPGATSASPKPPAAASTAAPTTASKPAAKIKRGGTLRYSTNTDFHLMDPHLNVGNSVPFLWMYDQFFRTRHDTAADKTVIDPELVESYERTDPLTLVYKLRKGVKFHDGSDFNATVAKWNLDRLMTNPKARKDYTRAIKDVAVVDDYTIKLDLKAPSSSELVNMMLTNEGASVISKDAVEKLGDEKFGRNPVGSGPFQFVEWLDGDHVTVKRWDHYWMQGEDGQPLPYMDGVVMKYILDAAVNAIELRTGNIDMTGPEWVDLLPKDIPTMKADPNITYGEMPWSGGARAMGVNSESGIFKNLKLRQAIHYGIDRDSMAKTLQPQLGGPWSGLWGPYDLGYDPSVPTYTYDPTKSKQLLAEAGYPNGVDISLTFINRVLDTQMAQIIKQMLDQLGFRVTLDSIERTAWVQKGKTGDLGFTVFNHTFKRDSDDFSTSFASDGSANWVARKNPEFDKCMEEGRSTPDQAKRVDIYKRCQQLLFDEAVYSSMFWYPSNYAYRKYVKGVGLEARFFNRNFIWLDK